MAATTNTSQLPPRFIKRQAVQRMAGLSCTEIYRRIAAGTFPKQITLGPKSVVWNEAEIIDWMDARIAESRGSLLNEE
ncbi:AlpA family phage regulatory protein [Pseudomonas sp. GD03855]|nr:AlpA family phage regulatory protein [Pseudomonas sp. GD03909]MDH2248664.1 AlpA family phage regulatory protein [Pseudomonas sp. GD03856]MDH2267449.1 AlpA family phage regulatory protein [Pseudomonas sp. GD03855]